MLGTGQFCVSKQVRESDNYVMVQISAHCSNIFHSGEANEYMSEA
jgi:hypothetical protein